MGAHQRQRGAVSREGTWRSRRISWLLGVGLAATACAELLSIEERRPRAGATDGGAGAAGQPVDGASIDGSGQADGGPGGAAAECVARAPGDGCLDCLCRTCEEPVPTDCARYDCLAIAACMATDGCRTTEECRGSPTCSAVLADMNVAAPVVDQLGACADRGHCPSCFGGGGAAGAGGTGAAGGDPAACRQRFGSSPCTDCACTECGATVTQECSSRACRPILQCMVQAGCSNWSSCVAGGACEDVFGRNDATPPLVDALGKCTQMGASCSGCRDLQTWMSGTEQMCASRFGAATCWPCACAQCDLAQLSGCITGADCGPAMSCMLRTGCRDPVVCSSPSQCQPELMAAMLPPVMVEVLGACLSGDCKLCGQKSGADGGGTGGAGGATPEDLATGQSAVDLVVTPAGPVWINQGGNGQVVVKFNGSASLDVVATPSDPRDLATDPAGSLAVHWLTGAGDIGRVDVMTRTQAVVASSLTGARRIASDGGFVYFTIGSSVKKVPASGGPVTDVASFGPAGVNADAIAVDLIGFVYWTAFNGATGWILRAPAAACCTATTIATLSGGEAVQLAVDPHAAGYVYWGERAGASGTVKRTPKTGGVTEILSGAQFFGMFEGLAVDQTGIFFTGESPAGLFRIDHVPPFQPAKLADVSMPGAVALSPTDDTYVYFIGDLRSTIRRLSK